jgi:D-glycero-D-manno-heptose 1,7-bisphosphate phosphatase
MKQVRRPACFLDRDGTLTEERGYAATAADIVLVDVAAAAVKLLNHHGIAAVLITNQSGVGRGYFSAAQLEAQHRRLTELLASDGAHLDGIYVCPHHPDAGCWCRKPRTGLLERAARELDLDLERSWVIGDREADVACGQDGARGGLMVVTTERGGRRGAAGSVAEAQSPERRGANTTAAPRREPKFDTVLDAVEHLLATFWRDLR